MIEVALRHEAQKQDDAHAQIGGEWIHPPVVAHATVHLFARVECQYLARMVIWTMKHGTDILFTFSQM